MSLYPNLVHQNEDDSEDSLTTPGWNSKIYKLSNEPLRFSKSTLYLSNDLVLTEVELKQGRLRNVAEIGSDRMTIGFYRKDGAFSVSGASVDSYVISLAYNGSKWDVVAEAPGCSQSIHLSPVAVKAVLSPEAHLSLMERLQGPKGVQAIAFPSTIVGEQLRRAIEGSLRAAETVAPAGELPEQLQWLRDDLMTATTCLIDELTEKENLLHPSGRRNRHLVALEIEEILWKDPVEHASLPKSIDEFAAHFGCSRRRIQQIIEETFGVGFVVLKRSIRLQQVHKALKSGSPIGSVGTIALEHEFENQGRFARYFRGMFGQNPYALLKGAASSAPSKED